MSIYLCGFLRGRGLSAHVINRKAHWKSVIFLMRKSVSVSSAGSLPPLEDDVDSVCSDELLGSQSRRWLADILSGGMPPESGDVTPVGRDGLFVDFHFPVGELEMQPGVKWKRPKVNTKGRINP